MKATAHMSYGPKILVAIQDGPRTMVYTGILKDGLIKIDTDIEDISEGLYVHSVPTGIRTMKLEAEFFLQYQGGQMKTWADIKDPEEITAGPKEIK